MPTNFSAKVEAAQFVATHDGEVCPAKWKKGGKTLKPSIDLVGKFKFTSFFISEVPFIHCTHRGGLFYLTLVPVGEISLYRYRNE